MRTHRKLKPSNTLAPLAGVFVLAWSESAAADDLSLDLPVFGRTTLSMTSTTTARYRGQNYDNNPFDDDFASIQQRFDFALQGDELRLELAALFATGRAPLGGDAENRDRVRRVAELIVVEVEVRSVALLKREAFEVATDVGAEVARWNGGAECRVPRCVSRGRIGRLNGRGRGTAHEPSGQGTNDNGREGRGESSHGTP